MSRFSLKPLAWTMMGTDITGCKSVAEAIEMTNMDFTVEKRPLVTYDNEQYAEFLRQKAEFDELKRLNPGNVAAFKPTVVPTIIVPDHFSTVRTDHQKHLGVVGRDYKVIQNGSAFAFIDEIIKAIPGMTLETAGALGYGERVYITARMPEYMRVGKDDLIKKYLFFTTSHDASGSIISAFTPLRITCINLLNAAIKNCSNAVRIRHTEKAENRLKKAIKVITTANKRSEELEEVFNKWSRIRITDPQLKELIRLAMAPNKESVDKIESGDYDQLSTMFINTCKEAFEYAMEAESQQLETCKGTLFGAYNAVSGYYQNVSTYKTGEAKMTSLLFGGTGQQRVQKAFTLCETFARTGKLKISYN